METRTEVTRLLDDLRHGKEDAGVRLLGLVYDELKGLAGAVFSAQRGGHTLQPTALVHEAWLKLAGNLEPVTNRVHFYRVAARAMRQVLADHARKAQSDKRGGGARAVTLNTDLDAGGGEEGLDLLEFHDSIERLSSLNQRHAQVVELRVLGTLTIAETAEALGVSHGTVETDWRLARAWMRRELRPSDD